jgi:hypothetical protein
MIDGYDQKMVEEGHLEIQAVGDVTLSTTQRGHYALDSSHL